MSRSTRQPPRSSPHASRRKRLFAVHRRARPRPTTRPFTMTVNGGAVRAGRTVRPSGAAFASVDTSFGATDARREFVVEHRHGHRFRTPTRPPAPVARGRHRSGAAEGDAELGQHAPRTTALRSRTTASARRARRASSTNTVPHATNSLAFQNLQPDATYEFTLDATDALRLRHDLGAPRAPQRHDAAELRRSSRSPRSITTARVVTLSWIPSTRQHPGRPLRDPPQRRPARRRPTRPRHVDTAPPQHALPELRGAGRRHQRQRDGFGAGGRS